MKVPRMPELSHDTTVAFIDVVERIGKREGSVLPSDAVKLETLGQLAKGPTARGITQRPDRAMVFHVDSASEPRRHHLVVLYLQHQHLAQLGDGEIVDAECSCPATIICRHLLMVLTSAARDGGLHLKV